MSSRISDTMFMSFCICYADFFLPKGGPWDVLIYMVGRNVGLKPYAVCHVSSIRAPDGSNKAHPELTKVSVRGVYRPDYMPSTKTYTSNIREVSLS